MDAKGFREAAAAALGREMDMAKVEAFKRLIQDASQQFNLTSLVEDEAVWGRLFLDSVLPYAKAGLKDQKFLDIGSGAGLPGMLLAIIYPELQVTLIEVTVKKADFLSASAHSLGLKNVVVINDRAENAADEHREGFDIVTARAVAALPSLLELMAAYAKVGGLLICPKSVHLPEELAEAKGAIDKLGLELLGVEERFSPTGMTHRVATFKKVRPTDSKYPRRWADIAKRPL